MPRNSRPENTTDQRATGALFQEAPLPTDEFLQKFQELVRETVNAVSVDASRNRKLEALIRRQTGWPTLGVKVGTALKNLKNRIAEIGNRADHPENAVMLVPRELVGHAGRLGRSAVASGAYETLCVVASDADPPQVAELLTSAEALIPQTLREAFPGIRIVLVNRLAPEGVPDAPEDEREPPLDGGLSLDDFLAQTNIGQAVAEGWLHRLRRKKHLIFQGPPGTGKTFIAKRLAHVLASEQGRVEIVQFHPSYSYEDFVYGLRAKVENGALSYSPQPGRFVRFCDVAREHPDAPHVLIIDEMNRGNLSKIFGELLFLLEYREESIPLAQSAERFSVPNNVYLIATMNTADRSIALVDHALRRRFSVVHLGPDYDILTRMLNAHGFESLQLVQALRKVNAAIGDPHYHLGTSFFLSAGAHLRTDLREIWQGEIEPYLEEYFFDQPSKVDLFRWEQLVQSELSWWAMAPA